MRGVPFSVRKEDIETFFKDYEMVDESIKIGRNAEGLKTGEAAVLFDNEKECKRAF